MKLFNKRITDQQFTIGCVVIVIAATVIDIVVKSRKPIKLGHSNFDTDGFGKD